MTKISRRDFLKTLINGAGAVAVSQLLSACATNENPTLEQMPKVNTPLPTPTNPVPTSTTPVRSKTKIPTSTESSPTEPVPSPTPVPVGAPELVVARGPEPEALVRNAFEALGGMQTFVKKGENVVIKPNICVAYHNYEYAATTNPWVVGALVKLALEAGAGSVKVMDFPFGGTQKEAYNVSGIAEQVKANGGEMAYMPGFKYVDTEIPNGKDLKQMGIFDDILKADVFINVPIAKHHNLAGLTLGMKNLMGVITNRTAIHRNIGQRLADLATIIYPTVTVIDAVRILMDHGPTGGSLDDVKKMDTLIVSPDIVAADSYASTLFGKQPLDMSYVQAGTEMGLGKSDLSQLRIEEITVGG